MPSYLCPRCDFTTSQRANFKRHLTRKNICIPINTDTPIKSIAKSYGIDISTTENLVVTLNVTPNKKVTVTRNPNTHNTLSPISNKSCKIVTIRYNCEHCNKSFATRQGKYRHKKKCKLTKNKTNKRTYTQEEFERELDKKNEKMKKEAELKIEEMKKSDMWLNKIKTDLNK